jgi:hypothetical protein
MPQVQVLQQQQREYMRQYGPAEAAMASEALQGEGSPQVIAGGEGPGAMQHDKDGTSGHM